MQNQIFALFILTILIMIPGCVDKPTNNQSDDKLKFPKEELCEVDHKEALLDYIIDNLNISVKDEIQILGPDNEKWIEYGYNLENGGRLWLTYFLDGFFYELSCEIFINDDVNIIDMGKYYFESLIGPYDDEKYQITNLSYYDLPDAYIEGYDDMVLIQKVAIHNKVSYGTSNKLFLEEVRGRNNMFVLEVSTWFEFPIHIPIDQEEAIAIGQDYINNTIEEFDYTDQDHSRISDVYPYEVYYPERALCYDVKYYYNDPDPYISHDIKLLIDVYTGEVYTYEIGGSIA